MASTSALLLGLVLAGPALWHAFVIGDLEITTALVRYLIAVAISAAMLGMLRRLATAYGRPPAEPDDAPSVTVTAHPLRRATDPPPPAHPAGTPPPELPPGAPAS